MGLKNKLNKMKSFLFDEEEEEKPQKRVLKKSIKKEEMKEKEPVENVLKSKDIEDLYLEDLSEDEMSNTSEIKSRMIKNEPEFKFPEFDDDDFMISRVKPEPLIPNMKENEKPILYQGSKRKEETKKFKPSPIISPIYGLLDSVDDASDKPMLNSHEEVPLKNKEDITFDEVRKKAYGSIDEEIENTMKRLSKKTIGEAEKDMETNKPELSRAKEKAKQLAKEEISVISSNDEDGDMILPNVNFKEIDVDKERGKPVARNTNIDEDEDEDDTKEQDLFNLIDTMYAGEEKED